MDQLPSTRMRHFDKEITSVQLFLPRQSCHRQHRCKAESPCLSSMKQILDLPLSRPFLHIDFECVLILDAVGAASKDVPLGPLGVVHKFHKTFPLVLFWNHDEDETVLAFIHTPRIHVP